MSLRQLFAAPRDPSHDDASRVRFSVDHGALQFAGGTVFGGDAAALLDHIDELVQGGAGGLLVTLNIDQVVQCLDDTRFADVVARAVIRCVDGMPLVLLSRMLGRPVTRITGADLLFHAARESAARHWHVVIAGGSDEVAEAAVAALRRRYQGANVSSVPFPMLTGDDEPGSRAVVDRLVAEAPSIVFLCLGAPKQELWFNSWRGSLPPAVYVGAGAAVDYAAGRLRRAPRWLQAIGGEWLWRLASEPRRLARRYLVRAPRFLSIAIASLLRRGRA